MSAVQLLMVDKFLVELQETEDALFFEVLGTTERKYIPFIIEFFALENNEGLEPLHEEAEAFFFEDRTYHQTNLKIREVIDFYKVGESGEEPKLVINIIEDDYKGKESLRVFIYKENLRLAYKYACKFNDTGSDFKVYRVKPFWEFVPKISAKDWIKKYTNFSPKSILEDEYFYVTYGCGNVPAAEYLPDLGSLSFLLPIDSLEKINRDKILNIFLSGENEVTITLRENFGSQESAVLAASYADFVGLTGKTYDIRTVEKIIVSE